MSAELRERADRLGVNHRIFGIVREPPRAALDATWPLLTMDEIDLFRQGDEDDLALANAVLEVEAELRARQWAALEHLLGLVATSEGDLIERVERLSDWAFRPAARDLYALGWLALSDEGSAGPSATPR